MGCDISSLRLEQNGVLATEASHYGWYYLDPSETISFFCPDGYTLTDSFGSPIPGGTYDLLCPSEAADADDYTILQDPDIQCPGAPAITTNRPTSRPTNRPTNQPTRAPTLAPTVAPVTLAPSALEEPQDRNINHDSTPFNGPSFLVDCHIPAMDGIVGFQASSNVQQVEMVRFPRSETDDGTGYYRLLPHDIITFACEDELQMMKANGAALQPHSANLYTYTWEESARNGEQYHDAPLPLTCEDRESRRGLRGLE